MSDPKFNEGDPVWVHIIPEIYWKPMRCWGGLAATVKARRMNDFGSWTYNLEWKDADAQSLMAAEWRPETALVEELANEQTHQ
jgi:hypothetical protein